MQPSITTIVAAAALSSAASASIIVDDFSIAQDTGFLPIAGFIPASSQVGPDGSILGGFRDMQTTSDADTLIETRSLADGTASFSNNADTVGTGIITWDGDDDPTTVDVDGLGGINISDATSIAIDILSADLAGLELTFTVFDVAGNLSSLTKTYGTAITSPTVELFAFADFTGSADIAQLGAVQLEVTGPAEIDVIFDNIVIDSVIPAPGAAVLMGVAGIAAARRRRNG